MYIKVNRDFNYRLINLVFLDKKHKRSFCMRETRKPKQRKELPKPEAQPLQKEPYKPQEPGSQNPYRPEPRNR